jgi:hypothetical protein
VVSFSKEVADMSFVNPFSVAVNPAVMSTSSGKLMAEKIASMAASQGNTSQTASLAIPKKKISLKIMTLNNDRQKVNDQLGNPIIIGIVVVWKVVNTAKAVFNVDNYTEYLQCDSAPGGYAEAAAGNCDY